MRKHVQYTTHLVININNMTQLYQNKQNASIVNVSASSVYMCIFVRQLCMFCIPFCYVPVCQYMCICSTNFRGKKSYLYTGDIQTSMTYLRANNSC